jgi:hypothetical protein
MIASTAGNEIQLDPNLNSRAVGSIADLQWIV